MPARLALTLMSFSRRMSLTMSITSGVEVLYEWKYSMSPRDPSVSAGQKTGMLFWRGTEEKRGEIRPEDVGTGQTQIGKGEGGIKRLTL